MSQTSNKSTLPRLSGLPRPSRLPVPQNAFDAPAVPRLPAKYQTGTLKPKVKSGEEGEHDRELEKAGNEHGGAESQEHAAIKSIEKDGAAGSHTEPKRLEHSEEKDNGDSYTHNETTQPNRRPRPSLSDRTIETLSQIPPSPSPRRRRSSFFPSESPERPSRPESLIRPRPSTSHGNRPTLPTMAPRMTSPVKRPPALPPPSNVTPRRTSPARRAVSSHTPKSVPNGSVNSRARMNGTPSKPPRATADLPSVAEDTISKPSLRLAVGSKTYSPRSTKPRAGIAGAFVKPEVPTGLQKNAQPLSRSRRDISDQSSSSAASSLFSPVSRRSSQTSHASTEIAAPTTGAESSSKITSSATLRDTIAKAKAAHRKAQSGAKGTQEPNAEDDGLFLLSSNKGLLRKRIEMARTDGRLNIAALGLTEIPDEVMSMYDLNTVDASGGSWYESVDITRLIAADNEIQSLSHDIFPDKSAEDLQSEDDASHGTLFRGLETLDLHGNILGSLPLGLRHLVHLTNLNLSKNKFTNDCLDTITRISGLRELRLAENYLKGPLPGICGMENLQVLDVHNNSISDLPDGLQDLIHLRVLDVAGNQLRSAPMESLSPLPLVELDLSRNRIGGTLLPAGLGTFRSLQTLDVSGNALASMSEDVNLTMPELRSLIVSENRLQALPNISTWTSLTNLAAANNALISFPDGMVSLPNLKNADFTGNNIKKLDDNIAMMNSLSMLNIANNPLRERRFLTMNTEDLKRELRSRLQPPETAEALQDPHVEQDIISEVDKHVECWPVKPGGVLDRSSTSLSTLDESDLEPLLSIPIRSLVLNHNNIGAIPCPISLFGTTLTTLDLSHNRLTGSTYFPAQLTLPALRDLNLASNTITSLQPIKANLEAPRLEILNVSYNRLTGLLPLRDHFPALSTIQASDNQISELPFESVHDLQVCNVARNDIGHLDPQLGLLDGVGGLRTLVVEGNRFRVPRREIVEGGTEKLLAWLRGRMPAS